MTRGRISATVVGETLQRPPRRVVWLEVTLRNDAASDVWVLLPERGDAVADGRATERLELYELRGEGRAVVLALRGTGFALLVPAEAEVTLRRLPLVMWDETDLPTLTALTATGLTLDGRDPGEVLRLAPATDPGADVDASPLENQREVVQTLGGIGAAPVAVEWVGAISETVVAQRAVAP
jgi:hypothetical protein